MFRDSPGQDDRMKNGISLAEAWFDRNLRMERTLIYHGRLKSACCLYRKTMAPRIIAIIDPSVIRLTWPEAPAVTICDGDD